MIISKEEEILGLQAEDEAGNNKKVKQEIMYY